MGEMTAEQPRFKNCHCGRLVAEGSTCVHEMTAEEISAALLLTEKEVKELREKYEDAAHCPLCFRRQLSAAVAAEREGCAKVADPVGGNSDEVRGRIAGAIRARGDPPGEEGR